MVRKINKPTLWKPVDSSRDFIYQKDYIIAVPDKGFHQFPNRVNLYIATVEFDDKHVSVGFDLDSGFVPWFEVYAYSEFDWPIYGDGNDWMSLSEFISATDNNPSEGYVFIAHKPRIWDHINQRNIIVDGPLETRLVEINYPNYEGEWNFDEVTGGCFVESYDNDEIVAVLPFKWPAVPEFAKDIARNELKDLIRCINNAFDEINKRESEKRVYQANDDLNAEWYVAESFEEARQFHEMETGLNEGEYEMDVLPENDTLEIICMQDGNEISITRTMREWALISKKGFLARNE